MMANNATIGLVQSLTSFQGVTVNAATQVKVSDHCQMLMVSTNLYRLSNGSYSQITTTGLSWSTADESLTFLLLTNASIAHLSPASNSFMTIYNVTATLSASTMIFSGKTPSNHSRVFLLQMGPSSVWFEYLIWKNNQIHNLLTYSKTGFTSFPSFSMSANGSKTLVAGVINGLMSTDAFSYNFTSMSSQNFTLPVNSNSLAMEFAISDSFSFASDLIGSNSN